MTLLVETWISLADLARVEGVALSTVHRWIREGCRGVRLESAMRGGRRITTREAFTRSVEASTKRRRPVPPDNPRVLFRDPKALDQTEEPHGNCTKSGAAACESAPFDWFPRVTAER